MSNPTPELTETQTATPVPDTPPRSSEYKTTSITFDATVLNAATVAAKERGYRSLSSYINYEMSKILGVKL